MRLATYDSGSGPRAGLVVADLVVDLGSDIKNFLDPRSDGARYAQSILDAFESGDMKVIVGADSIHPVSSTRFLPPIPHPNKILCIGRNYGPQPPSSDGPSVPEVFAKFANCLIGKDEPIRLTSLSEEVDYEVELGVIIGRTARNVSTSNALEVVAGYTIVDDVSVRDYQLATSQWTAGKSFDKQTTVGPWIVTCDEIDDPQSLRLSLEINGEIMQDDSTENMLFSVAQIVSFLSQVMTLDPGDLISTGTPAGVGASRQPPRWLRAGDTVTMKIEGIGAISNPVVGHQSTELS